MPRPIPYATDVEQPSADEAETHAAMIETFRKIQQTTLADYGHAVRCVHAKSHGLLEGTIEILDNLPAELAQGAFTQPDRHSCVLRFSTNPGDILYDSVSTPRGLALKIIGVSGERLQDAEGTTQDFVMANAPAFTARVAKTFLRSLKLLAATTDTPQVFKKAFSATLRGLESVVEGLGGKSPTLIALGGHPETHILGETFYSQVPLRWGDYVAKVAVAPVSPELTALTGASLDVNGKPHGLREAMQTSFERSAGAWEVRAQLRTGEETMPVEDAAVVWPEEESPYVPVARITVPKQAAWSDARSRQIDDGMAFSPWQGLVAHRPLGSIMRARRAVYPRSAAFRAQHNGRPIHEPAASPRASV